MKTKALIMAALMVASVVAAFPVATATDATDALHDPNSIEPTPGELLSSTFSVQDARLRGELDERTFGIAMVRAGTDEARARTIAESLADLEDRLDALEQRADRLETQYDAGEISERRYRAEMTRIVAEIDRIQRFLDVIEARSGTVPEDRLAERHVEVSSADTIRDRADGVVTRDARAAVRLASPADAVADRIDRTVHLLERTEHGIERAHRVVDEDETALGLLARADAEFTQGMAALANARSAHHDGDDRRALRYVTVAINHAQTADALTNRAIAVAQAEDETAQREAERHVRAAVQAIGDARAVVDRAQQAPGVSGNDDAQAYLERAITELDAGNTALSNAQRALDRDDYRLAIRYAQASVSHAEQADHLAYRAIRAGAVDDDTSDDGTTAERAITRAASQVTDAGTYVDRAERVVDGDREAQQYLDRAIAEYRTAQDALTNARTAFDRGEYDRAERYADAAIDHADAATTYAHRAIELAQNGDDDRDADVDHHDSDRDDTDADDTDRDDSELDEDDESADELDDGNGDDADREDDSRDTTRHTR